VWSELSGKQKGGLVGLAVVSALVAGYWLGRGDQPVKKIIERKPIENRGGAKEVVPTPVEMVLVDVKGAVVEPGVYEFEKGARVQDAIEQAGGFDLSADVASVNLAEILKDGDEVDVKYQKNTPLDAVFPISINSAPLEIIEQLPGIGPGLATELIRWRSEVAPFETAADLERVPGIGPETVRQILPYIKFD
jgi:competence protein ComEA